MHFARYMYVNCRRKATETITRRPDRYGAYELRQWDGGYDWKGNCHTPIWVKIAKAILDRGLEFEEYIQTGFTRAANAGSPYPNKLLSPASLDHYQQYQQAEAIRQCNIKRRTMENQFKVEVGRAASLFRETFGIGARSQC